MTFARRRQVEVLVEEEKSGVVKGGRKEGVQGRELQVLH
jgi:hypothetical protein